MKIFFPILSNLISGLSILVLSVCLFGTVALGSERFSGKILILPFQVTASSDQKKLQEFSEHTNRTLRTDIRPLDDNLSIETQEATDALLQHKSLPYDRQKAIGFAGEAGARLVVFGFLTQEGPNYRLQGEMWDLKKKRIAVSTDVKVTNIFYLQRILRVFVGTINKCIHGTPSMPFYQVYSHHGNGSLGTQKVRATHEGLWRSPELNAGLRGLDIGDIDGDKRNEIVLVDESVVTINRFEKGNLKSLAQFSQRPAVYLSVEVKDLDGDGQSELIICYQTPKGLESEIFRYDKGSLRSLGKHSDVIIRAIADPFHENKFMLVGQRTDVSEIFSGKMIRFRVDEKQITPIGELNLPPGMLLLSYTSGKMGRDAQSLRIILNQDQRLMVFDQDNRLVHSNVDRLFGLNRTIRLKHKGGTRTIALPGRLLLADTDGDGENELLVTKQTGQGCFIQDFTWDGANLVTKWNTVESRGIITNFCMGDFKNDGTKSLVLLLVKHNPLTALFGGPRSVVFAYDLTN